MDVTNPRGLFHPFSAAVATLLPSLYTFAPTGRMPGGRVLRSPGCAAPGSCRHRLAAEVLFCHVTQRLLGVHRSGNQGLALESDARSERIR